MTQEAFAAAALKQPPLFCQSPETLERHYGLAESLHEKGHVPVGRDLANWICLASPVTLCLADDNFLLRMEWVRLGREPGRKNILTVPRHKVEREVMALLGHSDPKQSVASQLPASASPQERERHERLCELMKTGLLKGAKFDAATPVLSLKKALGASPPAHVTGRRVSI